MSVYIRQQDLIDLPSMRQERVEKAREQMKKDGIGAVLAFQQDNIEYLTDTETTRLNSPWMLITRNVLFPRNGDPRLYEWGFRYTKVRDELCPWLKGHVYPGWRLRMVLQADLRPQAFLDDLKKVLEEHDLLKEPVGIDIPIVTIKFPEHIKSEGIEVVDAGPSLYKARAIKTKDEIACFKESVVVCDEIFGEFRDAIKPGVTETDLMGLAADLSHRRECDSCVEAYISAGERTYPGGRRHSNRPIRPGDMIILGLNSVRWRGYHAGYCRTFICGRATEQQKEVYAKARELQYKAIDAVKPGVTTADIAAVWPGPEYWGRKTWREVADCVLGYGVGLDERELPTISPLISPQKPEKIEENMILSFETYYGIPQYAGVDMYFGDAVPPGVGARVQNSVLVTKDGCEILTTWPDDEPTEAWIW
ncbi:M24 family metallopeptidase [Chloroflexota bacterium]